MSAMATWDLKYSAKLNFTGTLGGALPLEEFLYGVVLRFWGLTIVASPVFL